MRKLETGLNGLLTLRRFDHSRIETSHRATGNTADPTTVPAQVAKLKERFNVSRIADIVRRKGSKENTTPASKCGAAGRLSPTNCTWLGWHNENVERAMGIEPTSLAWEARVITIIRRPRRWSPL